MPDDDPDSGGLTTTGVISRRNLIIAATAGGVGLSELVSALGDDDGTGLISGGIMALAQAYNVAGDLYVGPYSARTNVDANSGRVYIASDREELLYGDSGSWVSLGTIGALTDTQTNNPDGGDVYQLPSAEDSIDLQGSGEVTDADLLEGHVVDLKQQADDGSDRTIIRGSDGNPKAEIYFDGTDTVINPLTGSVSVPGSFATEKADITGETFIRAARGTANTGITSGDWTNVFDGESKDVLNEFNSSAQFSPSESGEYSVTAIVDIRSNTEGDEIAGRLQNVTDGTTVQLPIRSTAPQTNHAPLLWWLANLDSEKVYEIQARNADSSFDLQTSSAGEIVRSVVG